MDFNSWAKNPNPVISPSQAWEGPQIQDGCVIKVAGLYYRFYCAGVGLDQWGIGYATATAAQFPTTWTKYSGNPVIAPTAANRQPAAPRVILMPDGSYRMYFHSWCGGTSPDVGRLATCSAAEFPNTWHYQNLEILNNGVLGAWDETYVQTQNFIPPWDSPDGLWHMHYGGYTGTGSGGSGVGTWRGGHATSVDGITWTRDPANPILDLGAAAWESTHVLPLGWAKIGGTYYITYQGFKNGIWQLGYITTTDLWTYTRHYPSVPCVPTTPNAWDSYSVEGAEIYQEPGLNQLYLFYLGDSVSWGGSYKVGVATLDISDITEVTVDNAPQSTISLSAFVDVANTLPPPPDSLPVSLRLNHNAGGPLRCRVGRKTYQIGFGDNGPVRIMTSAGVKVLI